MEVRASRDAQLEIRSEGGRRTLVGRFPYGAVTDVVIRGRRTQERVLPRAFEHRNTFLLAAHTFEKPLATLRNGSLEIENTEAAVEIRASFPNDGPGWIEDTLKAVRERLIQGISPGFVVTQERKNAGVREIVKAEVHEYSLVANPAYKTTSAEMRARLGRSPTLDFLWL